MRDEVVANGVLVSGFNLGYDALDRIVEETTLPEPAQFAVTAAAMSYDDDDRLTAWNALTTESDADGNLTKGPLGGALATFAYDARNRLTGVGTASYTYDAENRRVARTVAGSTTTSCMIPTLRCLACSSRRPAARPRAMSTPARSCSTPRRRDPRPPLRLSRQHGGADRRYRRRARPGDLRQLR